MAHVDWYIEGKSFGNCNCVYGCPCQFEDLPTDGHCNGFEVLHIDKGHFGDVDLAGLRTAMLYAWPGPIFDGSGEMQAIIDERANDAQRAALKAVLHGGETDEAEVGNASTKATGAIKLDLNDSYGQWHFMRHAPSGVVH